MAAEPVHTEPREIALRHALDAQGYFVGALQDGGRHDHPLGHGADGGRSPHGASPRADFHVRAEFSRSRTISRCAILSPSRSLDLMIADLHVHTRLSSDSNVAPEQYLEFAKRSGRGLSAICLTEHRMLPSDSEVDRRYAELEAQFQIAVFKGVEVDTDLGHLLLFGVTDAVIRRFDLTARMLKSDSLIEVVHHEGGVAIPAHPFRDSGYGARLDALLSRHGAALGAIEVLNGQNSIEENRRAEDAALKLGLTAVGGSDAHFATAKWFMTVATEFEREVSTIEQMCAEIRAGRVRPYVFPGPPD